MTRSDFELVLRTARLARLEITPAQAEAIAPQFARILEAFQVLERLELEGVEALSVAGDARDVVRDDTARPGLEREALLRSAPGRVGDFFGVPLTVGGER